jgi:hypothetical protein
MSRRCAFSYLVEIERRLQMKTRVQARRRVHLGVVLMAAVLSLLGAEQLRLELSRPSLVPGHVFAAGIAVNAVQ